MAYISSGVACSHVPALGVASDTGIADDDYYGPIFKGFESVSYTHLTLPTIYSV